MLKSFLPFLYKIECHFSTWLAIFLLTASSIAIALYYQYALDWDPCVLCIQIRIIMFGLMLLAFLMMFLSRFQLARVIGYIMQSILAVILFIKCRELYRIEVGLQDAACMFNAGLPEWFNLEVWLPSLFEVRSACGESPEMLFGISMAEALYFSSAISMIIAIFLSIISISHLVYPSASNRSNR